MGYLNPSDLIRMGFKSLGKNVKISDKASIYEPEKISIGDHTRIDDFCIVSGNVQLGRNIHITPYCNLAGGEPGIVISDFSTVAYRCTIISQTDDYSGGSLTNSTLPARYKKEIKLPVVIHAHCIIGTHSVIFPGVTLGEGCAVGAMTLIRRSTEPWSIYAGNPARKIKERKRDILELIEKFLEEE